MITIETKQEKNQEVKPFPKLMISEESGDIVYFERERFGVRLRDMHSSLNWSMSFFKDYTEEVTIKIRNDE